MITKKNYKFASLVTPVFQKLVVLKSPEWPDLDFVSEKSQKRYQKLLNIFEADSRLILHIWADIIRIGSRQPLKYTISFEDV